MGKSLIKIIALGIGTIFVPYLAPVLANELIGAAFGPGTPRQDPTSTSIKTGRPPRRAYYGQSRQYGAYILYETAGNGTAVDVFAMADGELEEVIAYYLADDLVTLSGSVVQPGEDGRYGDSKVNIYVTDGSAPGAGIPALEALLPGVWDADRRGDGVVLLAATFAPVKSKNFLEIYPNSTPQASMVAKWQKCPDPNAVDPSDESGWTWTENSIRHLLHYKLKREAVDYVTKIAPTIEYWKAAAAVCDENVPLKAGGTEKRYRSAVGHALTDPHKATTQAILATCDGWIAPRADGALVVYAGKFMAPTVSIGSEHIVGYEWSGVGVDDDTAVNEITLSYLSAEHDYNQVDTDPWTDESDILARGKVISDGLELAVPSHGQMRRLAKRRTSRNLAINRGTVTTNIAGRIVRGQRYINLKIEEAGRVFFDGVAEITELTRNIATGGVTFKWIKADPNIDAWNPATEEGDPASVGDRVAVEPLDAPVINSAVLVDGQVHIDATGPDRDDLTWLTRWRLDGATAWTEQTTEDADPGSPVLLIIGVVPPSADIEIEVAYSVGDGRVSPWSATADLDTSAPPAQPTGFSVTPGTGEADLDWTNPTSPNFVAIRVYENTSNSFGTATLLATLSQPLGGPGAYNASGLSAGTHYFWIASLSSGGAASAPVASGAVTIT